MVEITLDAPKERRDAAEHRRRILAAARALFSTQGVDATNMKEIARAANIGQGTLYRRFGHKGALCEALLQENIFCFQQTIESHFSTYPHASAFDKLEHILTQMIHFNEQNHPLLAAMIDSASGPRREEFFQSPYYLWMYATLSQLLEKGIVDKEIHELDVNLTAHLIITSLKGTIYYYQQHQPAYTSEQILVAVRGLLIDGLRVRK